MNINYSCFIPFCSFLEVLKYFDFNCCLMMEFLLVSNHFQSNEFICLMIFAFVHFSKWPCSQHIHDFVSIGNMVILHIFVISPIIIIPTIRVFNDTPLNLLNSLLPSEIHFCIVENLSLFIIRDEPQSQIFPQALSRCHIIHLWLWLYFWRRLLNLLDNSFLWLCRDYCCWRAWLLWLRGVDTCFLFCDLWNSLDLFHIIKNLDWLVYWVWLSTHHLLLHWSSIISLGLWLLIRNSLGSLFSPWDLWRRIMMKSLPLRYMLSRRASFNFRIWRDITLL